MSDLTPVQIERRIREQVHRGDQLVADYAKELLAAAHAEVRYRRNYNSYLLLSEEKTVARQEADAMVRCADEGSMLERKTTAAVAEATKQALYMCRDQLSSLQSYLRSVRDEMKTAGWGDP